ncbi:MAG: universal stress protein [Candidatus Thorarchaeota archaeon]
MNESVHSEDVLMPVSTSMEYADMISALLPLLRFQTSQITLFHVIETPVSTPLEPKVFDEISKDAELKLKPLREWLVSQGYIVTLKIAVARRVSDAIIEEVNTSSYSLVFMMKRRTNKGLGRYLQKSVTETVIRSIDCPVISVLI